jgi:hypothetical protein
LAASIVATVGVPSPVDRKPYRAIHLSLKILDR